MSLDSLQSALNHVQHDTVLRQLFFEEPMRKFLVLGRHRHTQPAEPLTLQDFNSVLSQPELDLDTEAIIRKCVESISRYVKQHARIALVRLAAFSILLRGILPTCLSALGTLESLEVGPGPCLGRQEALAIKEHCPKFSRLTCYMCLDNHTNFISELHPNTLQEFKIYMHQDRELSIHTLAALADHTKLLRHLSLSGLSESAIKYIHTLGSCPALETIHLSHANTVPVNRPIMTAEEQYTVGKWLNTCQGLRQLSFYRIPDAFHILHIVLQSPDIHLEKLSIVNARLPAGDDEWLLAGIWSALGRQQQLSSLKLECLDSPNKRLIISKHPKLVDAICGLYHLTCLRIAYADVSSEDIIRIATALPGLEELLFGGDTYGPQILQPLGKLSRLAMLEIRARTQFTYGNLWEFAQTLYSVGNRGIQLVLLRQTPLLTGDEEWELETFFTDTLEGTLIITYTT
ncbi:hypothetical protein F5Y08DRAFT_69513 [Xylaria arbuscula]|nr:hypothetical protein F5Y08DRAFT_69513 [Xylaria arbuscula]